MLPALADDAGRGAVARQELRRGRLHAPHIVDAEVLSIVRRKVLAGHWPEPVGRAVVDRLARMSLRRHGHRRLLARAWELRDAVSAYDAQYVALAEALGATLVTADVRLSRAPGLRCEVRVVSA